MGYEREQGGLRYNASAQRSLGVDDDDDNDDVDDNNDDVDDDDEREDKNDEYKYEGGTLDKKSKTK